MWGSYDMNHASNIPFCISSSDGNYIWQSSRSNNHFFSAYRHSRIKCEAGDKFVIVANQSKDCVYAWLTSYSTGYQETVPLVSGTTPTTISAGGFAVAEAPQGAKFLYILRTMTRYDSYDSLPSSILRMTKYPSEKIVPLTLNLKGDDTGVFTTYTNSSVVRCVKVKQGDIINYYTYYASTINAGRPITLGFSQYLPAVNGTFTVVDDYRNYSQNTMIDNNYVAPFDGYFCVCHEYGTEYYTNYNFSRILKGDAMAKPLRNEKMIVFGDSIFQFIYSYTGKGLVECLADETNATIIRGAIGGTRLVPRSSADTYSALDISNLIHSWVTNSWDAVDAAVTAESTTHPEYATIVASLKAVRPTEITSIILEGGLNDLSNSSISFGTATDANIFNASPTNTTLYGAINYIMRDLFSANPYIKVFWVDGMVNFRPVDRTEENWVDNKTYTIDNATYTTPEYFAKLTEQFGKWKVPHISLANICINPINFSEFFLDGDSTHPYKSFDRMARGIASQIASKNF